MKYDALLVIDMQRALTEGKAYNGEAVAGNIGRLLKTCRAGEIPVIYVRHDGGKGDELEPGSAGWEIDERLAPMPNERIFEKKYNSAFRETGLREYLARLEARNIILCGMQTEYCIDATCKVAFEYGYHVTIAKGTTTTFDNNFASGKQLCEYFENKIWDRRYAVILPLEQLNMELNGDSTC